MIEAPDSLKFFQLFEHREESNTCAVSIEDLLVYSKDDHNDTSRYFIKSEVNRNPYIASNTKYHGTGGYLTVQEPAYTTPLVTAFLEGGAEMGYEIRDCNAAKQTGDYKLSILNND